VPARASLQRLVEAADRRGESLAACVLSSGGDRGAPLIARTTS